uniref:Deacetylase sirtuin-type domain-containing protein n=1 Tax=Streptomyces sp. NBC_00008 TaxID=2903610 RepID=A0AAU2VVC1_9ACTN
MPTTAAPAIGLTDLYLYHSASAPADEVAAHHDALWDSLAAGGWKEAPGGFLWTRRDLKCRITEHDVHPQDAAAGRTLPVGYRSLDVQIASVSYAPPPAVRQLPWNVLSTGIRFKDRPGTPTRVPDLSVLADMRPFQVEIGCGTSVEAGIPPLHRLHEIYRVTDRQGHEPREHRFTLSPTADTLLHEVLTEPEEKTAEFVEMFRACFLAEPTPAMRALKELKDAGHLVGPVITNNFDVLAAPRAPIRRLGAVALDAASGDGAWRASQMAATAVMASTSKTVAVPHPCPSGRTTAVNSSAQRPRQPLPTLTSMQVKATLTAQEPLIPKLRARVRFSSPAP